MKKYSGIIFGLVILAMMGFVLWQLLQIPSAQEEIQSGVKIEPGQTEEVLPAVTSPFPIVPPPPPVAKPPVSEESLAPVACTMDAKMCPDGSYVGRVAPDCAFAQCPDATSEFDLQMR